jgi:hypothetical protein
VGADHRRRAEDRLHLGEVDGRAGAEVVAAEPLVMGLRPQAIGQRAGVGVQEDVPARAVGADAGDANSSAFS